MKALVFHKPTDVRIDTVDDPRIEQPGDAILRITSTAICGSDLHIYNGYLPQLKPMALGHEFMGIVEEVGPDVTRPGAARPRDGDARRSRDGAPRCCDDAPRGRRGDPPPRPPSNSTRGRCRSRAPRAPLRWRVRAVARDPSTQSHDHRCSSSSVSPSCAPLQPSDDLRPRSRSVRSREQPAAPRPWRG